MSKPFDISKWQPVTCLVTGRTWLSADFEREIGRRVSNLKGKGLENGDLVFLFHNNSLEFLADLFAVWALGGTAVALAPTLAEAELKNLKSFANPKLILVGPEEGKDGFLDLSKRTEEPSSFSFDQDFGFVLFTSGTTGKPKGVVHTKASITAKVKANVAHFGPEVFERSLCLLSSHFVAGLFSNILSPLAAGGRVFLFPDPGVLGAGALGKIIDEDKITMLNSVPSLWNIVLKTSPAPKAKTLKLVSVVSAPLAGAKKAQIQAWAGSGEVLSLYGTTETGGWNTTGGNDEMNKDNVGHILGGEAALLSEAGEIIKTGTGELIIKTPAVMSQYLNRPGLNRRAFIDGWFKTGDLAEIDDQGTITVKGRVKTQINRAGIKIIPEEIETLLEQHPDVEAACVFSYPDPVMGEGVAVAIEAKEDKELRSKDLRAWCQTKVRAMLIPEKWFMVKDMPRNERGKMDRQNIRDQFIQSGGF